MPENIDERPFGFQKIKYGSRLLRGGYIVPTGVHTHKVVENTGFTARFFGLNCDYVPNFIVRWLVGGHLDTDDIPMEELQTLYSEPVWSRARAILFIVALCCLVVFLLIRSGIIHF